MFKRAWGAALFGIARLLDVLFGGLITVLQYLVHTVDGIRQILAPLLSCAMFFVILNPFSLLLFSRWQLWIPLFIIMVFPLLGTKFVSFLDYAKYVLCEYLYDRADWYRIGKKGGKKFGSYGASYRKKQEEAERAERERNRRAQQEQWDRLFDEWFRNVGAGGYYANFGGQQGGYSGYQNAQQNVYNPAADFIKKYEESCKVLGLSYSTDSYQVKLAYRKLAKQYHPDINKAPGATEMFQRVNSAYEFLSEENIQRYKQLKR